MSGLMGTDWHSIPVSDLEVVCLGYLSAASWYISQRVSNRSLSRMTIQPGFPEQFL